MKLGSTQKSVLRSLTQHSGFWHRGCGWLWDTYSGTERVLDSLVRRGLVDRSLRESRLGYRYDINDAGKRAVSGEAP